MFPSARRVRSDKTEHDGMQVRPSKKLHLAVITVAAVGWPSAGAAQERIGGEFQVNTYTTGYQVDPAVAVDADGRFVVVWSSDGQDGFLLGIFGQRFGSDGRAVGGELQVNSYTTSHQSRASVAKDAAGDFVVVWDSLQDGSQTGVFGKRFFSSGLAKGPEFQANTFTTSIQSYPSLGMDAAGNFTVVWQSYGQDGGDDGIFRQAFDSSGSEVGAELPTNTYNPGSQDSPSVAMDPDGDFVVVWQSYEQDGDGAGVFGQLFDDGGAPVDDEFQVSTHTTAAQGLPSVAMNSSGDFVVVWRSFGQDGSSDGVFGQRFDSGGTPLGDELRVNTYTTSDQTLPAVAMDAAGNFVVVWESYGQDGYGRGIFGQRFGSNGTPLGGEFQINTYTTSQQGRPSVAMDAAGNFIVVWQGFDGDGYGIFGQRFRFGELDFFVGDDAESAPPVPSYR